MNKKEMNSFVDNLLKQMTLEQKIGQLYETNYPDGFITGPALENSDVVKLIKEGKVGSIIGLYDNQQILNFQKIAVEKSPLHIPLFFANDIIHGCRTILPIPLAMASSWNLNLIEEAIKMSARESYKSGVNVVFSPVADLARDPRWGRVMEGAGEDPYLTSRVVEAFIKGYQTKDADGFLNLAACVKHYIGYGASLAGRDYNSVDMSIDQFKNYYLPPFKKAVDKDVKMVMTSFNTFNGVPVTCNPYLVRNLLKKELKFKGVVISDYTSTLEIIKHKVAISKKEVAYKCLSAGVDHEMISDTYIKHLTEFSDDPIVLSYIDDSARRVLNLKYELGLFHNPYKAIDIDFTKHWLTMDAKEVALKMAHESICLLENRILPLSKDERILFIGPFIDNKRVIGAWAGKADENDAKTIINELLQNGINYDYFKGCNIFDGLDLDGLASKINKADKIVIILGEDQHQSGENKSRVELNIPSVQDELLEYVMSFKKPTVLMLHAGRPLILTKYKKAYLDGRLDAICYLWFLGTMSAEAIVDTLFGKNNPSGKITMSFPYSVGQIPIYYNHLPTGRPKEIGMSDAYLTRYIDCSNEPLYPFGYGLSYSKFIYQNLKLKQEVMDSELSFSVEVLNDSNLKGSETIQVYIECLNDLVSRPVSELKSFKKLSFLPHEMKVVEFKLTKDDLNYYCFDKKHVACGKYGLKVGPNAIDTIVAYFEVK